MMPDVVELIPAPVEVAAVTFPVTLTVPIDVLEIPYAVAPVPPVTFPVMSVKTIFPSEKYLQ